MKKWICLLALVCVGCGTDAPVIVQATTTTGTPGASSPTTTTPRALPTSIDRDGLYKVGADISPGTWHTDGGKQRILYNPDGSRTVVDSRCHWAVGPLASQQGHPFILHPTGYGDETGSRDETIAPTDEAFQTLGCRDWHLR
jgi:hypothetical protein